jgi:hypothetical protein
VSGQTEGPKDRGTGLLLVMMDIDPAHEDDFNRWYDEEHVPERTSCPGFRTGRRFVSVEGGPKYLAIYELDDPDVLDSEAYKAMVPPTEWQARLQPHIPVLIRNVYRDITADVPADRAATPVRPGAD